MKGTGFPKWLEASFQLSDGARTVCQEGKRYVVVYFFLVFTDLKIYAHMPNYLYAREMFVPVLLVRHLVNAFKPTNTKKRSKMLLPDAPKMTIYF